MNVYALHFKLFGRFRAARMKKFEDIFCVSAATRILDVGGGHYNWRFLPELPQVTVLNLHLDLTEQPEGFSYLAGDGRDLQFSDRAFDIVFSNSVIEHVGDWQAQREFAAECRRCGRGYFVQTPNRWFPVDPHTWFPFLHWLPDRWFKALIPFSPHILLTDHRKVDLADFAGLRMLSVREMKALFPDATIIRERFCGITKSIIAVSQYHQQELPR